MVDESVDVKQAAAEAAAEGKDLREKVKAITLRALAERRLDKEGIREVIQDVTDGVSTGLGDHPEKMQASMKQAVQGIDDALGKSAEAAKLAVQEAIGRTSEFTDHDLKAALEELAALEDMFLETLDVAAKQGSAVTKDVLEGLLSHFKVSGTAAGDKAKEAVDTVTAELKAAGRDTVQGASQAGRAVGEQIAQIASGILSGMAEALQPKDKDKS